MYFNILKLDTVTPDNSEIMKERETQERMEHLRVQEEKAARRRQVEENLKKELALQNKPKE